MLALSSTFLPIKCFFVDKIKKCNKPEITENMFLIVLSKEQLVFMQFAEKLDKKILKHSNQGTKKETSQRKCFEKKIWIV